MVVVERSPTANELGNTSGWTNPSNAHASDNVYATAALTGKITSWKNYGFTIPSGSTINAVKVKVEHREDDFNEFLYVKVTWNNGVVWSGEHSVPQRLVETIDVIDVTAATSWTPEKLSDANFKVKCRFFYFAGCFARDTEFPLWRDDLEKTPQLVKVQDLKPGDAVIGWNLEKFAFEKAVVLSNAKHEGKFTIYHIICKIPEWLQEATIDRLKRMGRTCFTHPKHGLCKDVAVTGNHPVRTADGREVRAAEIVVGDYLSGCFGFKTWKKKKIPSLAPVEVVEIETWETGECWDLQTDHKHVFKHYMMDVELK